VIPLLEEENPDLLVSFQHTLNHLQHTNNLLEAYTTLLRKELISNKKGFYLLNLEIQFYRLKTLNEKKNSKKQGLC
jgi:hypothetical protein